MWLDALVTNVDRTPRNPNLLVWHGRTWLIDHGAALYLQHGADDLPALAERPFPGIADHVLLPHAASIADAHARLRERAAEVAPGRGRRGAGRSGCRAATSRRTSSTCVAAWRGAGSWRRPSRVRP